MNKGLKRQRGAVLLVVLVVSLLSSLLVFTSIQENQLQTRLSGNFHKKINAQLSAEQGMNESYRALRQALGAEPRIEWDRLVQKVPGKGEGAMAGSRFSIEQLDASADSKLALQSHGRYLEGNASLNALFALKREPGNLIFQDSVVACEGLSLSGSGLIDSYDSRKGKYGGTNINQNAKVATVSDKANVVLDGHSPIWGDVRATGSVTLNGSSPVAGNVLAGGDITISPSNAVVRVEGSVNGSGNLSLKGGHIAGAVSINGDVSMGHGTSIADDKLNYGGNGSFLDANHQKYLDPQYRTHPKLPPVAGQVCDPLNVAALAKSFPPATLPINGPLTLGATQQMVLTTDPSTGSVTSSNQHMPGLPLPGKGELFGKEQTVYKLDSLNMGADASLTIKGDVVLLIDKGFTMTGSNKLTVSEGSSLTLIVSGKVDLGAGAEVTAGKQGLTAGGTPAISIYSAYSGKDGVKLSGNTPLYAALYAPLTEMKISGSGGLYGAVRAKHLTESGAGGVHYDEALGMADLGDDQGPPPTLALRQWHFVQ
ncbi:polymer-forming cytoskeletal protein [Aeromonas veronii]|nr:polymer-forming cytoskeletal protein [Aeromonas veronii]